MNTHPSVPHSADVLTLELLYLDLQRCTRCRDTDRHIEEALSVVRTVLSATGRTVEVRKIHVQTEAQARDVGLTSSPTIRLNGRDIVLDGELAESTCQSCGEVCGDEGIACRVWRHQGQEYEAAPVGLIVDAVLREVYGGPSRGTAPASPAPLPDNIARFFTAKAARGKATANCC